MNSVFSRSNAPRLPRFNSLSARKVLVATTAVLLGFGGVAAPAQAATAAPSAVAAATAEFERILPRVVVPNGESASVPLGPLPAGTTSVTIAFQGVGAWRETAVTAAVGPDGAKKLATTAKKDDMTVKVVTLQVPAKTNGMLTMWSSLASVEMRSKIIGTSTAAAPASNVTPTPAPVTPATSVAPNASNTGVPAGTQLKVVRGDMKITQAGAVINAVEVFGMIRVEAPNVTIKNSLVHGTAGGSVAIYAASPAVQNLLVQDVEIAPQVRSLQTGGVFGHDFTLRRVNIHGVIDQVHVFDGDNVLVENSYLHSNTHIEYDPNHSDGSHDDNIQVQEGRNIVIRNNVLKGSWNAAVQVTQGLGPSSDIRIENNWVEGGGCALNISDGTRGRIPGLAITGNKFGDTKFNCQILVSPETKAISTIRSNTLYSGAPVKLICRYPTGNKAC